MRREESWFQMVLGSLGLAVRPPRSAFYVKDRLARNVARIAPLSRRWRRPSQRIHPARSLNVQSMAPPILRSAKRYPVALQRSSLLELQITTGGRVLSPRRFEVVEQ